jgi:4-hydroxybenzoyl-CoA reductase subunit beta
MDALHDFTLLRPRSLDEMLAARRAHPGSRLIGGGTDILVNIRRGIEKPGVLIETNQVRELAAISASAGEIAVGASVRLAELAAHADVRRHFPAVAEAAHSIAGPSQRNMGTVGGNLCLDTRCIYYNQSEWWRGANSHCLKTELGEICHVAPKSRGVCFATFSGDLAPAFLLFDASVDLAGAEGRRTVPLADLYIGYARQDGSTGDGRNYLALRPGEIVMRVRARNPQHLVSAYDKIRIRRSIEYPVAGVAAALRREGDTLAALRVAFTGTNPRPVLLEGTAALCGRPLGGDTLAAIDDLCRDQIMAMKTTFTPGHYRRRVATVLAKRLVQRLWDRPAPQS